jgi:beta-lactamase class A
LLTRRETLALGSAIAALALLPPAAIADGSLPDLRAACADLEKTVAGRLGVAVLDTTADGRGDIALRGYRLDERFPMCSTFKFLAAACILARVDQHLESLSRQLPVPATGLVAHSPVTEKHAGRTMPIDGLCEAAITVSDNTAANLLLGTFGGPSGLTSWLRSLGDEVTQLDRTEPTLNDAVPGDSRDTTSPAAMVRTMQRLLLGDALAPASRERLAGWLAANTTGGARLRAGVPSAWRVGDKTGSGANGATNDIAILWPPRRPPLLVAVYLTETAATPADRDTVHAAIGRLVSG